MLTIEQFETYVEELPRASHDMEHITNFGRIVAKGFVLVAATIDSCSQRSAEQLVEVLGGETSGDRVRSQRAKARANQAAKLREQLAALESDVDEDPVA